MLPAWIYQFPAYPFYGVGCRLKGFFSCRATFAESPLLRHKQVLAAEEQTAAMIPAVWFAATYISQSTVNFLAAAGMVADCRNSVANISLPLAVISY